MNLPLFTSPKPSSNSLMRRETVSRLVPMEWAMSEWVGRRTTTQPLPRPLAVVEGHVEEIAGEPARHIHVGQRLHLRVGATQTARQDGHQLARDVRGSDVEQAIEIVALDDQQLDLGDGDDRRRSRRGLEQAHLAEDLAGAEHGEDELLAVRRRGDDLDPPVDHHEDRVGGIAVVEDGGVGRELLDLGEGRDLLQFADR